MKNLAKTVLLSAILLIVPVLLFAQEMKREETLFTGGALWSTPSNWNPLLPDNAVQGTVGLVYDPLFYYNPVTAGDLLPNLADSGKWINASTFQIKIKKGIKWNDGQDFTVDDVVFTFVYEKDKPGLKYNVLWNDLKDVAKIDDSTVNIVFKNPTYQQLKFNLYNIPMVPKHIWATVSEKDAIASANKNPVGTGPYKHELALEDRDIFVRDDNWWGKSVYGKLPAPKRVVVLKGFSNNTALGMIMKGELDVSNFFLFGIPALRTNYNLKTFYANPPYNFPWNTAIIFLNTKKAPLNDPKFRRALAFAMDSKTLAERVYEKMVGPCDATGLHPSWADWVDKGVMGRVGFKYDPAMANKLLDQAGYKDVNRDKFREDPKGNKIALGIEVPFGWTDWMESIKIIAENCRAVGINLEARFPDYGKYQDDMTKGTFDLILNNWGSGVSSTPYTYWNWVASKDIKSDTIWNGNWGRYDNQKLFDLIGQFDKINPATGMSQLKKVASQIEEILLTDMPSIPLWFNGAWFAGAQDYWTGYPDENNKLGVPLTWNGAWQMGGVAMLLNIQPPKK
jgi:peptide/nickel transport system substrate-binding protein